MLQLEEMIKMGFQTEPPTIKGNTISNLILVDNQSTLYGEKNYSPDKDVIGFRNHLNTRDIFLNVNAKLKGDNRTYGQCNEVIIHETTHNILAKHFDQKTCEELDNLFYNDRLVEKIKKDLFGIGKSGKVPKKYRRKNYKKRKLDTDFWLWKMDV